MIRMFNYLLSYFGYKLKRIRKDLALEKEQVLAEYEKEARRFLWLQSYDFKSIVDVGSNEGQFAQKILTLFPAANLHCFEPIESVFAKLKENLTSQENVFFYNFGLGEKEEEMLIFKNEYTPSSSMLTMLDVHKRNFDFAIEVKPEKIKIRTLDSFFDSVVNDPLLIKIDVQGYELFVLRGGIRVLEKAAVVILETSFYRLYREQPLFNDIYDFLIQMGFEYFGNVEQLLAPKNNAILQADAVFISSKKKREI
jgi:FkbM family methyltransferase